MNLPRNSCSWGIGTAISFRNESKSILNTYGTNLQNPSDEICKIYYPDDGKIFVQADCAGAEALIVAYLCRPGNFRALFENRIKPHTYVAMHLFSSYWSELLTLEIRPYLESPISELAKLPRWKELAKTIKEANPTGGQGLQYYLGKKCCHSFNYGKMPQTFIYDILKETEGNIVLTLDESKYFHETYFRLFPEIAEWHLEQEMQLRRTRTLHNLFGFPITFYGPFTPKYFREAKAWIAQSTVGCITNVAFCYMQKYIEESKKDWHLLNNKHDSILLECQVEDRFDAAKILSRSLEQEFIAPRGEHFKMRSEVSVGMNWGHCSKENPEGLKEIEL